MILAKEIMTAPVVTLDESTTLRDATITMTSKNVSGAPVLDGDGGLIGLLSDRDILDAAMSKVGGEVVCRSLSLVSLPYERTVRNEEVCRRFSEVGNMSVGSAMSTEVIAINGEDSAEKALITMIRFDVNRLPVIDGEGKLIGMVARQDILWSICRTLQVDEGEPITIGR